MRSSNGSDDIEKEEIVQSLQREIEDLEKVHRTLEDLVDTLKDGQWES